MEHPVFPLVVHDDERPILRLALKAYRDDLGHEEHRVAAVVDGVARRVPEDEAAPLELDAADLKVTWSALHTLLDDSVRAQQADREHLRALLDRLPGEHDVRAIDLDTELARRGASLAGGRARPLPATLGGVALGPRHDRVAQHAD